jgi:hypothetical protein
MNRKKSEQASFHSPEGEKQTLGYQKLYSFFFPLWGKFRKEKRLKWAEARLPFLMVLLLFCSIAAQAQFGIKGGATFGKIAGESFSNKFNFGFHAGVYADIRLAGDFGLQPEILFNQVSASVQTGLTVDDLLNQGKKGNLDYVSVPVLLRFSHYKLFSLQAGPQFSVLMNPHNSLVQNGKDFFNKSDLSLALGAELHPGKAFRIYGRYNIGLSNIGDITSSSKWTGQQIQAGIGINLL